jgi:hypothetical protein
MYREGRSSSLTKRGFGPIFKERKMTQNEWVLSQLKRGKKLTALDALEGCGSFKLATRISELKAKGHNILSETISKNGKRFARYSLVRSKA